MRFESKYLAIQHFHRELGWSIRWMCSSLGISKAAYYKWLHRSVPKTEQENILLVELIREYDKQYEHILGYRRMTMWINRLNGTNFSPNRIHRIMKAADVHSAIRKKLPEKTEEDFGLASKMQKNFSEEVQEENVLQRRFSASAPNEKWATDVTEFCWHQDGVCHKIYLSVILDLYDRSVVSGVISRRNDNRLVLKTLDRAVESNPDARPLFHSDRSLQYTGTVFREKLQELGMEQSVSRGGRCIDNGPVEGFWGIIKSEMYYLRSFRSERSLRRAIKKYIRFYNYERFQERFGGCAPMEIRAEALRAEKPRLYPIPENKRIQKYKARLAEVG